MPSSFAPYKVHSGYFYCYLECMLIMSSKFYPTEFQRPVILKIFQGYTVMKVYGQTELFSIPPI